MHEPGGDGGADRWAYLYDDHFGVRGLVDCGDSIAGVFVAPEKPGTKPDPLRARAEELGIPVFQFQRYGSDTTGPEFLEVVRAQAAKRVALEFVAQRTASWDHRKLGGVY